jgi:hypothetical protein
MALALDKYKTLVEKKQWKKKSKEQLEFLALKSELELARKQLVQNPLNIRDGHSAVWNNFYNLEPWIFSVMLVEIYSQVQFPLTK